MTADIHSRAMLVKLSVSCWVARKFDRKISKQINDQHEASSDAGRYNKQLLGGRKAAPSHAAVIASGAAARAAFYANTLPWEDEGWRLLPTANYEDFTKTMRNARETFEANVETFCLEYPELRETARVLLNGMFNASDYPSKESMRSRFSFGVDFNPVPREGDFRLELPQEQRDAIAENTEARVEKATQHAMRDAWGRLQEVVEKVAQKLANPKGIFRDSMIRNTKDMAEILGKLNVTGDEELERMRSRVIAEIANLDPDSLRKNEGQRQQAAKSASDILDAMRGIYGGN